MKNSTEILIRWDSIYKIYKYARMDKDRRMYAYTHKSNAAQRVWTTIGCNYIEITNLVVSDTSKLDWKTFIATREEEVKVETKEIYYTKEMQDNNEMPLVNMYFVSKDGESKVISTSKHDVGIITYTYLYANSERVGNCKFNPKSVLPIDTRTDEEKLIDDVADFLIDNDEDSTFICRDSALNIASYLFKSSKFTITKKGD